MVGIVDVGLGNIRSVENAVLECGVRTTLIRESRECASVERLILPGVGSFTEAMNRLDSGGFAKAIQEAARSGTPILGICLGMQLLAERGSEGSRVVPRQGLGLVSGSVNVIPVRHGRLPHVGWNTLFSVQEHPILRDVPPERDYYFVHSFSVQQCQTEHIIGTTEYNGDIVVAAVASQNVVGLQFHPEKSQKNGLQIVENFCCWDGLC